MSDFDYSTYLSPFTWRYGSEKMRQIFSEEEKYKIWRQIWVEMARAQNKKGLVSNEELENLELHQDDIDIGKILEYEKETRHDVVAAIHEFADKAKIGGGKIHLGATSMDIVDNTDSLRLKKALDLIEEKLIALLDEFGAKIERYSEVPCIGYTHLQPAEPTTIGYRFSLYAQDLLSDLKFLRFVKKELKAKGFKGAVGTSASYVKLLGDEGSQDFEDQIMKKLGINAVTVSNQTTPRKIDSLVALTLSQIAQSLNKFAFDLRIMQSPAFGEWQEPFSKTQVGSSAMPFKRNPIKSEQICSLARLVINLSQVASENASVNLLERTLDDSANRRVFMPEIFLAADEILTSAQKIVSGLIINDANVKKNLDTYAPFAALEEVMIEAVKNGANRQVLHEELREISMIVWKEVQEGKTNDMFTRLADSVQVIDYVDQNRLKQISNPAKHIGTAPKRAKQLLDEIRKELQN